MASSGKNLGRTDLERQLDGHRFLTRGKGVGTGDTSEDDGSQSCGSGESPRTIGFVEKPARTERTERCFLFFCAQLPLIVFALTFGVAGVYCYRNEALVYEGGVRTFDKASEVEAACNKFRMIMMAMAGFTMAFSLLATSALTKGLNDSKLVRFVDNVWSIIDPTTTEWEGKDQGRAPSRRWHAKMIKDLDPNYEAMSRVVAEVFVGCCRTCWDLRCVKYLLPLIPLPLLLHPVWWWKRIFDFGDLDFDHHGLGDLYMEYSSGLMTTVFAIAAIWQHAWYMYDEVFVSRFAALEVGKKIAAATKKLETVSTETIEKHMNWREELMNWREELGIVVTMKTELDKLWGEIVICFPWLTLGLSGVVILLVGGITGLQTGFFKWTALGTMARNYTFVGCAIILYVLWKLSSVSAQFCELASKAEAFHGLYLRKTSKLTREDEDMYLSSIEKFVEYVQKNQIGARLMGGVLITRSMAWATLEIMVAGISFLSVVNEDVLDDMRTELHGGSDVGSTLTNETHRLRNVIRVRK